MAGAPLRGGVSSGAVGSRKDPCGANLAPPSVAESQHFSSRTSSVFFAGARAGLWIPAFAGMLRCPTHVRSINLDPGYAPEYIMINLVQEHQTFVTRLAIPFPRDYA